MPVTVMQESNAIQREYVHIMKESNEIQKNIYEMQRAENLRSTHEKRINEIEKQRKKKLGIIKRKGGHYARLDKK